MKRSEQELIEKYQSSGHLSGGELLLPFEAARDFAKTCVGAGFVILGIDFFLPREDDFVPVMPVNSLDASEILQEPLTWNQKAERSLEIALSVLAFEETKDPAQYSTFALQSEDE